MLLIIEKPTQKNRKFEKPPFVSVLIALRNEEENVAALCDSLKQLSYAKSDFEILFGNDDSEDDTLNLLERNKPVNSTIYSYGKESTGKFGKQRILSYLSEKAKGEYLLFTDADMRFQSNWIQSMLTQMTDEKEIVVGLTRVSGNRRLGYLQNIDWLFNEWVIGWFSRIGIYLTGWGNNMLIAKSAYNEIGGYAGLDDSIVEDVDLLRRLRPLGGELKVNINSGAVATTQALLDVGSLLHQRKRWMRGLAGLNPLMLLAGMIKILFWPAFSFLALYNIVWCFVAFAVIGLKYFLFMQISKSTGSRISVIHLLLFEIYDFVFYLITFAFYLLPIQVVWKGRKY
ncbi:glycosyltransferase [Reichenbachiella faecimaris]|nr:glycosyltransferase [Reichenbachiella faecimaris]